MAAAIDGADEAGIGCAAMKSARIDCVAAAARVCRVHFVACRDYRLDRRSMCRATVGRVGQPKKNERYELMCQLHFNLPNNVRRTECAIV